RRRLSSRCRAQRCHCLVTAFIRHALVAAVVGLSLNEGAYTAENIRGGFLSVDKGQLEAADSLGFSEWTKVTRIIIPQSLPTIIPATGNRLIGMFKDRKSVV